MSDVLITGYAKVRTLGKFIYNFNIDRFDRYFLTSQIPSRSLNKCLIQEKGEVFFLVRKQVIVKILST